MNQENTNTSGEFVNRTLARLQKTYRVTLIVAIAILAAEGIYLSWLNNKLKDGLTVIPQIVNDNRAGFDDIKEWITKIPAKSEYEQKLTQFENALNKVNEAKDAEGVANLISQRVVSELDWQGYMIASHARDYLQEEMQELPDWMNQQIPKYGARLSHEVDNWAHNYFAATSEELGTAFDTFLDNHADQIREFSEATDDKTALDKLDQELIQELANFMETTALDKYGSLKVQSDRMLRRIKAANELLEPIARKKASDLSSEERRLSRAIGLFMERVHNPPPGSPTSGHSSN